MNGVVYPSVDQLESGARKVCEAAVAMVEQSYAPYSNFRFEEGDRFARDKVLVSDFVCMCSTFCSCSPFFS